MEYLWWYIASGAVDLMRILSSKTSSPTLDNSFDFQTSPTYADLSIISTPYLNKQFFITLQVSLFVTKTFLAARSLCTNPLLARYCIPSATCCEKLSSSFGVSGGMILQYISVGYYDNELQHFKIIHHWAIFFMPQIHIYYIPHNYCR